MSATDSHRLSLIAAGVCALIAGAVIWLFLQRVEDTAAGSDEAARVLVAQLYIARGSPLHPRQFRVARMPGQYVQPGAVTDFDLLESSGRPRFRTLLPIPQGTQLLQRELVTVTQGDTLAQMIEDHFAAVSFPVDLARGLGGNLQPGDVIDILHTASRATAVLFENVPVIAVGKKWAVPQSSQTTPAASEIFPDKPEDESIVITVLLNAVAAVRLAQARENGILSVMLRSPEGQTP